MAARAISSVDYALSMVFMVSKCFRSSLGHYPACIMFVCCIICFLTANQVLCKFSWQVAGDLHKNLVLTCCAWKLLNVTSLVFSRVHLVPSLSAPISLV